MNKKSVILALVAFVLLISGCETTKGFVDGLGAAGSSIAEGAKKDWNALQKADGWMRDNLW